jgi:hypothetical protein
MKKAYETLFIAILVLGGIFAAILYNKGPVTFRRLAYEARYKREMEPASIDEEWRKSPYIAPYEDIIAQLEKPDESKAGESSCDKAVRLIQTFIAKLDANDSANEGAMKRGFWVLLFSSLVIGEHLIGTLPQGFGPDL